MFTNKTPHFFKVIFDQTIRDGKLEIPKYFVRKYGKRLSSPVHLEVPTAEVWQVELTKRDESVWLQKGWQKFAEHYSLKHGHFMVFRYLGNAHFHVVIFDRRASEIQYPRKERKEKSDASCLQPNKKMKVDSPNENVINLKSRILNPAKKGRGVMGPESPQIEATERIQSLTDDEKTKALEKASRFRAKNPFFLVVMQPSFISSGYRMPIPFSFARKYFKNIQHGYNVILCISNWQTWPAMYYWKHNKVNPQLRDGWRAFAQDNALEVGDVCVFELTKKSPEIMLKVVIYRIVEETNAARSIDGFNFSAKDNSQGMSGSHSGLKPNSLGRLPPLTTTEKNRVLKLASDFKSANPFFTIAMQPSYVTRASLNIPYAFAVRYFKGNGEITLRVSDGRTWIVNYRRNVYGSRRKARFHKSWRAFVRDNNLKVGDVCVFELIKASRILLDVVIFPAAGHDIASCTSSKRKEADDDDSIEILEDIAPCKKRRKSSPIQCPWSPKMNKTNITNKTEKILKSESLAPRFRTYGNKAREIKLENVKGSASSSSSKHGLEPSNGTGRGRGNGCECPEQAMIRGFRLLTAQEKAKTLRIANTFNSKNPFFLSVIQPSNTSRKCKMSIPFEFIKKHLKEDTQNVILQVADRGWSMKLNVNKRHLIGMISAGWMKFARDNCLKVGDVCVFKMITSSDEDAVLNVTIFRRGD